MSTHQNVQIHGRLIARNALLNALVQVATMLAALVFLPTIVRGLGPDRFGLITIVWVLVSYASVLDLGLTRALTKFAADALGTGETRSVRGLIRTAVAGQVVLGLIGAAALLALTPILVRDILRVPAPLAGEAGATLRVLALGIPVILVSGSLRGALEATQRFDLVNAVRFPGGLSLILIPAAGVALGLNLPAMVAGLLAVRLILMLVMAVMLAGLIPAVPSLSGGRRGLKDLLAYGGWVTVSSVIDPILGYLDRFIIARLLTVAAVGYYAAPFEIVARLLIIPASLTSTLFPAFSTMIRRGEGDRFRSAFTAAVRYLMLAVGVAAAVLIAYGRAFLHLWLGPDFARQSGWVIQILALGTFVNSLAYIPYALMHALGRPDLTAKFHMIELPIHLLFLWTLVGAWGITGAAVAWATRVAIDALLLFIAASRHGAISPRWVLAGEASRAWRFLMVLAGLLLASSALTAPLWLHGFMVAGLLALAAVYVWRVLFEDADRARIVELMRSVRVPAGAAG
ncbi:MAG: flippase [Armatimonadota bacterium]|nr:flippase [Armatimonadota bacterium]MDR7452004.1 flippase [Armatimonadota bacterium]MDR7467895.1 flippase [Armatimonadota bacterium]MDR7494252.1 flippase [Armatimonadota bacterium]MDR7500033.1 flippase [Armatimonadota bacterium]